MHYQKYSCSSARNVRIEIKFGNTPAFVAGTIDYAIFLNNILVSTGSDAKYFGLTWSCSSFSREVFLPLFLLISLATLRFFNEKIIG